MVLRVFDSILRGSLLTGMHALILALALALALVVACIWVRTWAEGEGCFALAENTCGLAQSNKLNL